MNYQSVLRTTLASAIFMALAAQACAADIDAAQAASSQPQEAAKKRDDSASRSDTKTLDAVVVSGSGTAGGVKKLDASYTITSANAEELKESNAKTTGDLLRLAPGVWPETSGGQAGANIEVAGFPGSDGSPFVTMTLMGSPFYPQPYLSFQEQAGLFRLDDTVERMEVLQGGPAVLYGDGQSGATVNWILKQGTEKPSGDIGLTYGSEGMGRLDGFYGFKIADNWYGSLGGFYRISDGVRDPQFSADKGGSLTATLTHDTDNGTFMVYARTQKDNNQFVADMPLLNPSRGDFASYPGFSALTGTFGSTADRLESLETTPCFTQGCKPGTLPVDLANGHGSLVRMLGGNFDFSFANGVALSDKFNITGADVRITSFYNTGDSPMSLGQWISNTETSNHLPTGLTATANYAGGGAADLNQNVITQGLWYVHKKLKSLSNEFRLSKELFEGNTLTIGNYSAVYSDSEWWDLGNNLLLQIKNNPKPIAVTASNGSNTWSLTDPQGFALGSTFPMTERWSGLNTAFFASDSWKLDRWLLDAGMRVEHQVQNGDVQGNSTGDLDDNPYTVYNNNVNYLNGQFTHTHYSNTAPSWTIGVNYEINDGMSAYARISHGVHFPGFDDLRSVVDAPVQKTHSMEVGFKYQSSYFYADLSAYRRLFTGVPYSFNSNPLGPPTTLIYGSDTKGINLSTVVKPFEHFSVSLIGNYMKGHYSHYDSCVQYVAQDGSTQCTSIAGMMLTRQPKVQGRVTPAYEIPTDWGRLKFWVTYEYVGDRYGDLIERQPLGNYHDLSFGGIADIGKHWELSLQGTNLTDEIGVTEGNARLFGSANANNVIQARSIEGREVNFQAKYQF